MQEGTFWCGILNIVLIAVIVLLIFYSHQDHVLQAMSCANRPITLN